jgi:anti-anti-sigma factor
MSELGKVFTLERKHGVLVVVPQGDAVGFRLADIDHELQELLEQVRNEDKPKLVIDFGHANYFGSVIISAVNQLATTVADGGGKIVICEVSDEMQQVLRVMKLDSLWKLEATRRKAIKAVNG